MKDMREITIEYDGCEFKTHPAGTGNPETDRVTELICNNLPEAKTTALIECGTGIIASFISGDVTCYHSNWIDNDYAKENAPEATHHFADFAVVKDVPKFDQIIFRITKSSAHNLRMISRALESLTKTGLLFIAGGNKEGIKGVSTKLKKAGVTAAVFANAGGGRMLEIEATESIDAPAEFIETVYPLGDKELSMKTQEGLFAYGKVDRGSAMLLKFLHTYKKKKALDLGCGSGILARALLEKGVESVHATDISAMAIDATKRNLPDDERVVIEPSYIGDIYTDRFDIILTNPPFHEGKGTTNTLGAEWLDRCQELLSGSGELLLVANLFLPYFKWGTERFHSVEELITEDGFIVYRMKSPMRKRK